jgi:hypothetical protein
MARTAALTLQFLGAASGVTGSKYVFSGPSGKVLIDDGLFQGIALEKLGSAAGCAQGTAGSGIDARAH